MTPADESWELLDGGAKLLWPGVQIDARADAVDGEHSAPVLSVLHAHHPPGNHGGEEAELHGVLDDDEGAVPQQGVGLGDHGQQVAVDHLLVGRGDAQHVDLGPPQPLQGPLRRVVEVLRLGANHQRPLVEAAHLEVVPYHVASLLAVVDKDRLADALAQRLDPHAAAPRKRVAKGALLLEHVPLTEEREESLFDLSHHGAKVHVG
mmetsp:Transcript_24538/g.61922  ORF Transcript_24538/g.61922 Transcript_24538/m.61922 type:complete len:206 (-) Transcript_24538:174-791(-)